MDVALQFRHDFTSSRELINQKTVFKTPPSRTVIIYTPNHTQGYTNVIVSGDKRTYMAAQVGQAVVGEAVSTAASFLTNKFQDLTGISDKVELLELKVLKIKAAVEESQKYEIENEALQQLLQNYMEAVHKANEVLQEFKNCSPPSGPQRLESRM